ncbi:hypothetical protein Psal160_02665 [Piscirickettsia salmonis]|nr:hypothetical protein KW89_452 [Piscirickettsia salmonis]QGO81641.1 hypothetical protein Psal107_02670 [Piscirickettsia salmonis]QGP23517.1 hypothetical protein Psal158_02669 [Piscirickettsia salmonis]QGP30277.1 hypothetical protein Psal160_02665 [Piscirickettsia salmonis]QGP33664.1 hypothetical protein Psal161_02674 [Piscirickettsia salmonis]
MIVIIALIDIRLDVQVMRFSNEARKSDKNHW